MKNEAVGAVIMASGLARRFGSNKLLADFGGEPMLCRVLRATEGISPRIVVTRSEDVHRLCVSLGVPVLLETDARSKCDKYIHLGMELAEVRDAGPLGKLYDMVRWPASADKGERRTG